MNTAIAADSVHSKALPDLVSKLLTARQESLVLYQKLAAMKPFTLAGPARHRLRQFQQALMDYLALGPFEVYQALEEQPADSPYRQARELARQLYTRIAWTTQAALAFHDRYDGELSEPALAQLDRALSQLGESLATRIELEDQILAAVRHSQAKTQVAA
ncbi:MAG TPA: Rsd/AlgQ family anti-sigma factor [Gammaproteobacteria bacterium]|nr:Rsd/AlgQ family anti-sigma factor [Gammaproteobacteria bacterium]HRF43208.1 Rsd/AlgQ family anti-sigma factor [Candidatus Competibacteraceae bacterium]